MPNTKFLSQLNPSFPERPLEIIGIDLNNRLNPTFDA